ncbi:unnamed protein product, partial [marine sediment metagenome]
LVLDCTAYSDRYIQAGPDRCAGLANLMVIVDKAQVDRRVGLRPD